MTTRRAATIVLVTLLSVAGCGDDTSDDAGGSTTTSVADSTTTTSGPADPSTITTAAPDATTTTAAPVGACPDEAPVPGSATEVVGAPLPFDGDGDGLDDQLTTFRHEDAWWVQATWSSGGSSAVSVPGSSMGIRPLGGSDLDGDGADEAWIAISGPASGMIVGVLRVDGCAVVPVVDSAGGQPFEFPVTSSIGSFSGASCESIGDISLVTGQLIDEDSGEYETAEVPYDYDPATGQVTAGPGDGGGVGFDEVGALATLRCGDLADAL